MTSRFLPKTFLCGLLLSTVAWGQPSESISRHRGINVTGEELIAIIPGGPENGGYGIKQEEPNVGHNVLRRVITGSPLPFDKKWSELTLEEQSILRARYEKLPADQEPPFPEAGLYTLYRPIRDLIASYTLSGNPVTTGKVVLGVTVAPNGQPETVAIYEASDKDFAGNLAQAIMSVRFKPGICAGKPCQMEFPVELVLDHRI